MKTRIFEQMALIALFLLLSLCLANSTRAQNKGAGEDASDALQQNVRVLRLENETFFVGVAKLNSLTRNVGFSVELVPGTPTSAPPPSPSFKEQIQDASLEKALDWLCSLDPRYTWRRDGSTVNIFPRSTLHDQNYFFNRRLSTLVFREVSKPMEAVSSVVRPVSKPNESLVSWQGIEDFPKPWTASLANVSVRQALNRIAQQLGPGYGWLVAGNPQVMIFSFHSQIKPKEQNGR